MPSFVFAFMDCEFGGLDPELHDITEIAVILTDDRLAELASAEWKVRARAERVSAEAAEISGWSAEAWADAPPLRQVLEELAALLPPGRTVVPAGQNVRNFEIPERNVRLRERPLEAFRELIGLAVATRANRFAQGLEGSASTRGRRVLRRPGPERVFVQLEKLAQPTAEDHGAEAAVADRKRLDPFGRWGGVTEDGSMVYFGSP